MLGFWGGFAKTSGSAPNNQCDRAGRGRAQGELHGIKRARVRGLGGWGWGWGWRLVPSSGSVLRAERWDRLLSTRTGATQPPRLPRKQGVPSQRGELSGGVGRHGGTGTTPDFSPPPRAILSMFGDDIVGWPNTPRSPTPRSSAKKHKDVRPAAGEVGAGGSRSRASAE